MLFRLFSHKEKCHDTSIHDFNHYQEVANEIKNSIDANSIMMAELVAGGSLAQATSDEFFRKINAMYDLLIMQMQAKILKQISNMDIKHQPPKMRM